MSEQQWVEVDDHLAAMLVGDDDSLRRGRAASDAAGLPAIDVSMVLGKLLMLLCRSNGARSVLEIGTLGGFSATWLARGVGDTGRVVTLELEPHHAAVARTNLDRAGVGDRVDIRVGPAAESLAALADEGAGPFDLVFIDADKEGYPDYLDWTLRLSRPGTVIVADNVVRGGRILAPDTDDVASRSIGEFLARLAQDPRLDATAVQTVGTKGWDGFALAVVLDG